MATDSGSREGDRVYSMLRKQILAVDLEPGSVLDEARIVQDMGTSRTPVREAVIRLVSDGLLKRDGRQVIVPDIPGGAITGVF
ncbi:GntR family transcriptional regulator [Komagataeibacter nataicola]|uniref:GntR family transcriptional regulator n=1 Tax=Komagataeibacter nataicola TaxID=265960 RepID=UPI0038CFDF9B